MKSRYSSESCGTAAIDGTADYFRQSMACSAKLPYEMIDKAIEALMQVYAAGRTVYLFGNGGSASLASHFACDLGKGTSDIGVPRLQVISLADNMPLMTAWANDFGYEHVFAEQLKSLVRPGDAAFAISGSGNSPNVLNALRLAGERGALSVGLTGFQGGKMKCLCDICVVIPSDNMQIIEDLHLSVAHAMFTVIRARIQAGKPASSVREAWAAAASAD